MVKDHSDSEKGNLLPPHRLLLSINSKGSLICTIPDRITHITAFVTPVVEHWLEWEIAQWVHPMKDRSDDPSHHERTLYLWATSRSMIGSSQILFPIREREREMFYLTTHSTHFIYGYMASDIWLRTILIGRKETRCRHIGYSYRLTARVLLYAPSHRQDSTYHGLCYTSRGALAGTRNSSVGPPHEGSIRRPIAPWANALPLSYISLPYFQ